MTSTQTVDIRRATDRAATKISWLDSKHSFSFGGTTTPPTPTTACCWSTTTTSSSPARALTPIRTATWRSSPGCCAVPWCTRTRPATPASSIPAWPNGCRRARGILHSEKNDSWTLTGDPTHDEPVHFVQMWVVPDESGIDPGYQQLEIDDELLRGGLVTIASGMPEHADDAAITIRNRHAALRGARLQPGDVVELPDAPYVHLFVAARRGRRSRARARCARATPCGSPHPAASGSPRPSRRRSWSGRCMRVLLRRRPGRAASASARRGGARRMLVGARPPVAAPQRRRAAQRTAESAGL